MTVEKKITAISENVENSEKNYVDLDQALNVAGKFKSLLSFFYCISDQYVTIKS